jgi:hypothetical protein
VGGLAASLELPRRRDLRLTVSIENITGEDGPGRGIEITTPAPAPDLPPASVAYLTPPPPRAVAIGLEWRF